MTAVRMVTLGSHSRGGFVLAAGLLALGCGTPPPAPMAPRADAPPFASAVARDPAEELVYPEETATSDGPPAAPAAPGAEAADAGPAPVAPADPVAEYDKELLARLDAAEAKASAEGRLVLETGRKMALVDREVIVGACWDYANTVYKRAGFPANKRKTVFNKPKTGPYADPGLFRPGDFLSYSHDESGSWVHSAIFIDWTNAEERVALMLSYPGGKRPVPAFYSLYDLGRVFRVVRPKP